MIRCEHSLGNYRITLHTMNEPEEFKVQIPGHNPVWVDADTATARVVDQGPVVSNFTPFEGEICEHELDYLKTGVPGTTYPKNWEFKVEKLGK